MGSMSSPEREQSRHSSSSRPARLHRICSAEAGRCAQLETPRTSRVRLQPISRRAANAESGLDNVWSFGSKETEATMAHGLVRLVVVTVVILSLALGVRPMLELLTNSKDNSVGSIATT